MTIQEVTLLTLILVFKSFNEFEDDFLRDFAFAANIYELGQPETLVEIVGDGVERSPHLHHRRCSHD